MVWNGPPCILTATARSRHSSHFQRNGPMLTLLPSKLSSQSLIPSSSSCTRAQHCSSSESGRELGRGSVGTGDRERVSANSASGDWAFRTAVAIEEVGSGWKSMTGLTGAARGSKNIGGLASVRIVARAGEVAPVSSVMARAIC